MTYVEANFGLSEAVSRFKSPTLPTLTTQQHIAS